MRTYTGRNIFKDVVGSLNMIQNDWQLTHKCTGYNNEMLDVVEEFRKEHQQWISSGSTERGRTPLTVTQNLWHSTYLEIQRLNKLGIEIEYKELKQIRFRKKDEGIYSYFDYKHDGRNLMCKVKQRLRINKYYLREGKMLKKDKKDVNASFYILWARTPEGKYICPNCGNESILEAFLDGCDYCGSKFHIDAFKKKVASFYLTKDRADDSRDSNGTGKAVNYLATALMSFGLTIVLPFFFFITIPVFIYSAVKFVIFAINTDRKGPGRNTMTKLDIWENIPDFSLESFISSVDNKVRALHFAEREDEVRAICLCSLNGILNKYENIVACDNGSYLLKDFQIDRGNGFYHITVEMDLPLLELNNNKLSPVKEHIRMILSKKITSVTGMENDVQIFRCRGCGSTVSLVEGGICKYCNTPIEMINHDWVITQYETVF